MCGHGILCTDNQPRQKKKELAYELTDQAS
jgi:hypothetical protein